LRKQHENGAMKYNFALVHAVMKFNILER